MWNSRKMKVFTLFLSVGIYAVCAFEVDISKGTTYFEHINSFQIVLDSHLKFKSLSSHYSWLLMFICWFKLYSYLMTEFAPVCRTKVSIIQFTFLFFFTFSCRNLWRKRWWFIYWSFNVNVYWAWKNLINYIDIITWFEI